MRFPPDGAERTGVVRWLEGIPGEVLSPPDPRSPAVRDEFRSRRRWEWRRAAATSVSRIGTGSEGCTLYSSAVSLIIQQVNPDLAEEEKGVVFCVDSVGMLGLKL